MRRLGAILRQATRFGRDVARRYSRDDGGAMAGYIAYTALLALFPFLIFATALAGVLIGPEDSGLAVAELFRLAPEHIAMTLRPVVTEVLATERGGLLTISAIGAIWVASNGFEAFRIAFDRAYDVATPPPIWRSRALSVVLVLISAVVFMALGLIIIAGPLIFFLSRKYLGLSPPFGIDTLRYAAAVAILSSFLFLLHWLLPSRRMRGVAIWPGVAVTSALWIAGASLFSVYLRFAPNYALTYGAMAGVIVTLLFFYLTGAVIILGAEVNAAIADRRRRREAAATGPDAKPGEIA